MRAKLRRFTDHTQLHRAHFVSILSRDKVVHQQLVWASRSLGARGSIHTSGEAGHKAGLTCATCMCLGVRKVRERKKEQTQKKQSRTAEDVFSVSLLIEACSLRSQHHERLSQSLEAGRTAGFEEEPRRFQMFRGRWLSEGYGVAFFSKVRSSHNTSTSWLSALGHTSRQTLRDRPLCSE